MAFINRKYLQMSPNAVVVFSIILFATACGIKKTVKKGDYLLKKNNVSQITVHKRELINDTGKWDASKNKKALLIKKKSKITNSDLSAQILHRANKRVILNKFPVYLWLYNFGTKRKQPELSDSSRFRRKLRNTFGEAPVILDSNLVRLSADNIRNYLFNSGFFDAKVETKIKLKRRRAIVSYTVYPGRAYLINSFFVTASDTALGLVAKSFADQSDHFRIWWPMDMNKLNIARTELAKNMRNLGYYTIAPESFHFLADTFQNLKHVALTLVLDNAANGERHQKFYFSTVTLDFETSEVYQRTNNPEKAHFPGLDIALNRYPVNPELVRKLVYVDSGGLYNQSAIEKTYQSLVQMGLFSVVDMRFYVDTQLHQVKIHADLKTTKRMAFSIEPQGMYSPQGSSGLNLVSGSQRSFGTALIVAFNNRNVAKHLEDFRLSSVTSYEAIIKRDSKSDLAYSLQQGFNASLALPHFQLFKKGNFGTFSQRNTVLSLSYQYENNPNFFRSAIPASLTFQYVKPKLSWYYTPTEVSFNRNIIRQGFIDSLPTADSVFIRRVFTNQFVTAAKFGFIYANNRTKPGETYVFVRAGFEASGNLHRAIRRAIDPNFRKDSVYKLFGLQYFQYSKMEFEVRLRRAFDELNSLAFRVHGGLALPYGNSAVVPYDKRYFIGGSNSLRAWRPRRLGPGSTSDGINQIIDRSGEFLLEANIEYRFSLIRHFLESAVFLDAGNIWNLNRKNQTAASESILKTKYFLDEVALNTGIGFRFDLKIFLFRIDWGIPLHDPGKELSKRWLLNQKNIVSPWTFTKKETALAIGIGYPF